MHYACTFNSTDQRSNLGNDGRPGTDSPPISAQQPCVRECPQGPPGKKIQQRTKI